MQSLLCFSRSPQKTGASHPTFWYPTLFRKKIQFYCFRNLLCLIINLYPISLTPQRTEVFRILHITTVLICGQPLQMWEQSLSPIVFQPELNINDLNQLSPIISIQLWRDADNPSQLFYLHLFTFISIEQYFLQLHPVSC